MYESNYYNIISCGKIKFATGRFDGKYLYEKSDFDEWQAYFQQDIQISKYLMNNLIDFERRLNSRVAYCIAELISNTNLSSKDRNEIIELIQKVNKHYDGQLTWQYIANMTLGEMKQILLWLEKKHPEIYKKCVAGFSFLNKKKKKVKSGRYVNLNEIRLNEINHLRNNLFHFRPLSIYLTYGGRVGYESFKNENRKDVVNFIFDLKKNREISTGMMDIINASDRFISIKKQLY